MEPLIFAIKLNIKEKKMKNKLGNFAVTHMGLCPNQVICSTYCAV
jgi:hypothetical protein